MDILIDLNIKNDRLRFLLDEMQLQNENVEVFDEDICKQNKKCLFFIYFPILIELIFSGSFFFNK